MDNKKIVIKGIDQAGKEKAAVRYEHNGQVKKSVRRIYKKKDKNIVVFKGVQYIVEFNHLGFSTSIKARGAGSLEPQQDEVKSTEEHEVETKEEEQEETKEAKDRMKESLAKKIKDKSEVKHHKFEEIKVCVENNIPVYLHGPAGSGKNHTLQQIADELELDFYFTNSVQQEFKLTGFIDAGGTYHETEFYKAFKNGGLFFLDEMDASIPEVLVLLNAALANGYFEFPVGKIDAHEDFRVVSAGNTVGAGADEEYAGRLQLDQATLDRFAMIEFNYDYKIELKLSGNNKELVNFIRGLRKQSEEKGISSTFSYRCITMVTKLEDKLPLIEIIKIAVMKGLDKDTIRTFDTDPKNKYSKALWGLKQAS